MCSVGLIAFMISSLLMESSQCSLMPVTSCNQLHAPVRRRERGKIGSRQCIRSCILKRLLETPFPSKRSLTSGGGQFPQLNYPSEFADSTGWQAYINGKPFAGDFRTIPLQAHTLITLAYQGSGIHPPTSFDWGNL